MNNCLELVNLLLKAGANVNHVSTSGMTALLKAAFANSVEIIRALLNAGAEVNAADNVM